MSLPSPVATKTCETCGKALEKRVTPSGHQERPSAFAKRRHCSQKCGAGRPPLYPKERLIQQGGTLRPEVRARLLEVAQQRGTNMSAVLRDIFDRWMAVNP